MTPLWQSSLIYGPGNLPGAETRCCPEILHATLCPLISESTSFSGRIQIHLESVTSLWTCWLVSTHFPQGS
jgi:hypothetical protein